MSHELLLSFFSALLAYMLLLLLLQDTGMHLRVLCSAAALACPLHQITVQSATQQACCVTPPTMLQVHWHSSVDAVPNNGPAIYIAHEFLDALPVHQFVKDPRRGWLEVS
jgi:hypothetical protein